jgi:hypothetical protein
MKLVYIASPYSNGDPEANVRRQIDAAETLMLYGFCPVVPLYSHYHNLIYQHPYYEWMAIDFAKLEKCDAVLRLPGESAGADEECERAKVLKIPIYYSLSRLVEKESK